MKVASIHNSRSVSPKPAPAIVDIAGREIFFVVGSLHVGGAQRHVATVSEALIRIGWRVTVYVLYENGPLYEEMRSAGVTILFPPIEPAQTSWPRAKRLYRLLRVAAHLHGVLRQRRPPIVHAVLPSAYVIGVSVAMLAGVPIRVMSRLSLNFYQSSDWRYRLMERWLHRHTNALLANANALISQLHEEEGAPLPRLGLIYLGIDASAAPDRESRSAKRAELNLAPSTVVLTIVANLIPYKGHADLIDALALASPALQHDWRVLVVGHDYGIGGSLQARAAERGVAPNVMFLGERQDARQILNASDIGILCSHQEGFSVALLEGMSAALPMIVTRVGGNAEAVIDGETGIVIPPSRPADLADAIVRLVNDAALRALYGRAARQRILDCFTIERCVEAYDGLYRCLLAGGEPRDVRQIRVLSDARG